MSIIHKAFKKSKKSETDQSERVITPFNANRTQSTKQSWLRSIPKTRVALLLLFALSVNVLLVLYFQRENKQLAESTQHTHKQATNHAHKARHVRQAHRSIQLPKTQKAAAIPGSSMIKLNQLVRPDYDSSLQDVSVEVSDDTTQIVLRFTKLPFYQLNSDENQLTFQFSDTKAGRTLQRQLQKEQGAIKTIRVKQKQDHLLLYLTLKEQAILKDINSTNNKVTLVLNHGVKATKLAQKTKEGQKQNGITKVKHKLSKQERVVQAMEKAKQYLDNKQYQMAIKSLQKAHQLQPENVEAIRLLAIAHLELNQTDEAMKHISQGLKQAKHSPKFVILKAYVLMHEHRLDHALQVLERNEPVSMQNHLDYYALLANLYLRQEKYERAADFYKQLLEYNSASGRWWIGLGVALENMDRNNEAQAAYRKALKDANLTPNLRSFASARARNG